MLSTPSPPTAPGPPSPPASHCILAPSGLLWLHDPSHASGYKLFQEHWRRGQVRPPPPPPFLRMFGPPRYHHHGPAEPRLPWQPILVSGLQKKLEGRLWGPESFRLAGREQAVEAVDLRAPASRVTVSSQEFWDGFTVNAGMQATSLWGLKCVPPSLPVHDLCSPRQNHQSQSGEVGTC